MDWSLTRIRNPLDLDADGRRVGDLLLPWSDNANPLGYYPVPFAVFRNGPGPTLLLCGGTHGDEYEGPAALLRLLHEFEPRRLRGRLLLLPALNAPALHAAARCSPLDGGNLNRAFPGDRDGAPTAMIAHLVDSVLLPHCDAAIDLHAGGRASTFAPLAMLNPSPHGLFAKNLALAEAFGCPLVWIMGESSDDRSLNAAAQHRRVPMFATELGGGGRADPKLVDLAVDGILRVMARLEMLIGTPPPPPSAAQFIEVRGPEASHYAPCDGLFVAAAAPGNAVNVGQPLGTIYSLSEPERPPRVLSFNASGVVAGVSHRGRVARGDFLALVAGLRARPEL